jgi:hypothetical protein
MDSVYNNTSVALNAGQLWQGRGESATKFNVASVTCACDSNGLLSLLQSQNNINYEFAESYQISANTPFNINQKIQARYFKAVFENTSMTNQTYLRIQTIYKDDIRDNLIVRVPVLEECIVNDKLNVNVVSGGDGGGLVQIQGYNGEDWENVSVAMGNLAVNDYQGNTKLDTLIDKKLNYDVDNVSVNKVVEPITYDLNSLGATMYADSINTAYPDPYGRDGWYWSNTLATGASNVYWYSNTQTQVSQNLMTKQQMDCVFVILALDRVQPNIVLPFLNFYSPPTGQNDIRPLFAHSFWTYTIDTTVSRLNAGEIVMLYFGDAEKISNLRPELRRVPLILNSTGGEALQTENIAFISLNTDSGNKPIGSIQYLIQNAGFHYTVTDKIVEYEFNNSLKRIAELNLSGAVSAGGQPNINVNVNTGGFELSVDPNNNLKVIDNTLNNKINSSNEVPSAIQVYQVNSSESSTTTSQTQFFDGGQWVNASATQAGSLNTVSKIQGTDGTNFQYLKCSEPGVLETSDASTTALNDKINNNATYPTAIDVVVLSGGGGGGGGDGIIQGTTPANPTVGLNLSCSVYNDGTDNHNVLETQSNVYGYNSATGVYQPIGVHATNMLRTQACVHTASGQDIAGTVINTVRGLNIYDVGNENLGTFGNILNGTSLTTLTASNGLYINKTYLNESVIVYEDTNTTNTGGIVVQVSQDDITYYTLATLFPVTSQAGKRATSSKLLLKPFNYIRILNNSGATYNSVICSLFSS